MNVQNIINEIDWASYRSLIINMTREAVQRYTGINKDKVYQISIWTDINAQLSAIEFETLEHAMQTILGKQELLTKDEIAQFMPTSIGVLVNTTLEYQYSEFSLIKTPQLEPLQQLDFLDDKIEEQVYVRFEEELLNAVQILIEDGTFRDMPHEEYVWMSINSIRDWFDHAQYVKIDA